MEKRRDMIVTGGVDPTVSWRGSSPSYRWKFHGAHLSPLYKFEEEE